MTKNTKKDAILTAARTGHYSTPAEVADAAGVSADYARHVLAKAGIRLTKYVEHATAQAAFLANPALGRTVPAPFSTPRPDPYRAEHTLSVARDEIAEGREAGYAVPDEDALPAVLRAEHFIDGDNTFLGAVPVTSGQFRIAAAEYAGADKHLGDVPSFVDVDVPAGTQARVFARYDHDIEALTKVTVAFTDDGDKLNDAWLDGDYENVGTFGVDAASAVFGDRGELTAAGSNSAFSALLLGDNAPAIDMGPRGTTGFITETGGGDGIFMVEQLRHPDTDELLLLEVVFLSPQDGESDDGTIPVSYDSQP